MCLTESSSPRKVDLLSEWCANFQERPLATTLRQTPWCCRTTRACGTFHVRCSSVLEKKQDKKKTGHTPALRGRTAAPAAGRLFFFWLAVRAEACARWQPRSRFPERTQVCSAQAHLYFPCVLQLKPLLAPTRCHAICAAPQGRNVALAHDVQRSATSHVFLRGGTHAHFAHNTNQCS